MLKKVKAAHNWSNVSSPDSILVQILTKCQSEVSYLLGGLFNIYFKNCFSDYWEGLSVVPLFKNVGKKSYVFLTKKCLHASVLSVFSKIFVKIVSKRFFDDLVFLISSVVSGLFIQLQVFDWNCQSFQQVWWYSSCRASYVKGFWQDSTHWICGFSQPFFSILQ